MRFDWKGWKSKKSMAFDECSFDDYEVAVNVGTCRAAFRFWRCEMAVALNLETMSIEEKIEAMEALWRDLSAQADYESPLWHKEVLEARENAPDSDWSEAKERIRERACE